MIRHPPRKEPRILAVVPTAGRIAFAVADPWEIRSTGTLEPTASSQVLALRRLIRREKPTVLVTSTPRLAEALTRAARVVRIPVLEQLPASVPLRQVSRVYPEFRLYAPRSDLERAVLLAIAAVLHSPVPPRRYATRRRTAARRNP